MEDGAQGRGMTRLGVLKVVVASGTNLAIRDFTSSDPYVVVRLADKHAKTKVINSCLNPVWNEEMVFSIEEPVGVIKFRNFQRDRNEGDQRPWAPSECLHIGESWINRSPSFYQHLLLRISCVLPKNIVSGSADSSLIRQSLRNKNIGQVTVKFSRNYLPNQEVFDRDRFKSDDKMGHAFLDLQPVAGAAKLRRALKLTAGETKLRKVAPSADNCLLSDSFVTYADREIVLDSRLRLRDVESGELFVIIKWTEADAK